MTASVAGAMAFACLIAATGVGLLIPRRLPDHHLSPEARDVIKLSTAIVGTLSALALGLLVASAKTTYDNARMELRTSAARIVLLDRVMARYGPETANARAELKKLIEARLSHAWDGDPATNDEPSIEPVQEEFRNLNPDTNAKKMLQARALQISGDIAEGHWMQTEGLDEALPAPFLGILLFWLALLFGTFGLLAPINPMLVTTIVCAISVAAAIFLIVDMDHPYVGFIHISDAPLRAALVQLGR